MRLNRADRIAGLDPAAARQLARLFWRARPEGVIGETIDTAGRRDADIARALAAAGYLEAADVQPNADAETWWITTTAGNALAQASFARPITRATADRLLATVLERTAQFNANPDHAVAIAEVVVFGSYLDPQAATLGDLDVGVKFLDRLAHLGSDEHTTAVLDYARASGRRFSTFLDRLLWPREEALRALRQRSSAINITTVEDVHAITDRWQLVYQLDV